MVLDMSNRKELCMWVGSSTKMINLLLDIHTGAIIQAFVRMSIVLVSVVYGV